MADVEIGKPVFTSDAVTVLREERRLLGANAAGVVERFGIRVRADQVEAVAEPPCRLGAERVVIAHADVVHQLNDAEIRERRSLHYGRRCTVADVTIRNRLIRVLEPIKMTASGTEIPDFEDPVLP